MALAGAGLEPDEAFLIAAKRTGTLDEAMAALNRTAEPVSDEPAAAETGQSGVLGEALEVSDGTADPAPDEQTDAAPQPPGGRWQWLGLAPGSTSPEARREFVVMAALACAAAVAIKAPELFGQQLDYDGEFYARNVSLLVLPFLAGYFAWKRSLGPTALAGLAGAFAAPAVVINSYPFDGGRDTADTEVLAALHLPILLWLAVGLAHAGGDWRSHRKRMDFVRFTGEWVIYFGLIALGGGVLAGSTTGIFSAIGIDAGEFIGLWLVPCGAAGAVVVAAWLAESRQGVLERIAPVLTRLFTPLFAALLVVFLLAMASPGVGLTSAGAC